ncbi:MAG: hypothetical protein ACM359_15025 [Bacillota bacterium]
MIQITCSKCMVVLTIDDAFAGGVCRCQHCGTIQTVPRELKTHGSPAAGRALMSKPSVKLPDEAPSLDDLEQVVASSGLTGTSLSGTGTGLTGTGLVGSTLTGSGLAATALAEATLVRAAAAPKPPVPTPQLTFTIKHALLLCVWSLSMFLLGMLVTWLVMRTSGSDPSNRDHSRADSIILSQPTKPPLPAKPSFMGLNLKGPTVIYLLDHGEGSANAFASMKLATIESAETLDDQMTFQVIFWETDRVLVWPPEGTTPAVKKNVLACRNALTDVRCSGQSHVGPALVRALQARPAEIVLATGQSGLGDDFVQAVVAARKDLGIRIHAVSFGDQGSPAALKAIADQTGGQFRAVPTSQLMPLVD